MNGHCKFKMKWFSGNSSTNAEGKFEYHEPKLLRMSRLTEYDEDNHLSTCGGHWNSDESGTTIHVLFYINFIFNLV